MFNCDFLKMAFFAVCLILQKTKDYTSSCTRDLKFGVLIDFCMLNQIKHIAIL